jgi:hypothetical protein
MVLAAIITIGSAIDYIAAFASTLRTPPPPPEVPEVPESSASPTGARLSAQPTFHSHP